jgi:adenine phosphoribosyltransferase
MNLKDVIRNVPDYPIKGVQYKDISGILANPRAFEYSIESLMRFLSTRGITDIVSPDARGFIWSSPIAFLLGVPLHMIRKPNKLPPPRKSQSYDYEYASGVLQIKADANLNSHSNVCIIDDVNATGGTAVAITEMLKTFGVEDICYASVIDLAFLGGSSKLDMDTFSVVTYE